MGLDYSYILQANKNKHNEILTYIDKHMHKESSYFRFENNQLYLRQNVKVSYDRIESFFEKADDFPPYLTTSLVFKEDKKIVEYIKQDFNENRMNHLPDNEEDFLEFFQVKPNYFIIGGIDITIGFYDKKALEFYDENYKDATILTDPSLMYFDFAAVTSDMSRLFEESESIRNFFIDLAKNCGAKNCFLNRDEYEDSLIWQNENANE